MQPIIPGYSTLQLAQPSKWKRHWATAFNVGENEIEEQEHVHHSCRDLCTIISPFELKHQKKTCLCVVFMLVCVHVCPQSPEEDIECPAVILHFMPLGQSFLLNSRRGWPASGIPGSSCLYPSNQGGCRHSWPCLAFHVVSGGTAFKSSCCVVRTLTTNYLPNSWKAVLYWALH